jgi:hypothetical protein
MSKLLGWFEYISVLQGLWPIKTTRRGQGTEIDVLWLQEYEM